MVEAVEAELVHVEPTPPPAPSTGTLFGTAEPDEVLARATKVAESLSMVLRTQGLFVQIRDRKHVLMEGWTMLGSMLGVFPVSVWTRRVSDHNDVWREPIVADDDTEGADGMGGWEARVEARTQAGDIVGAAEAECRWSEEQWARSDSYALRSMAQTRATSKALRLPLGFVIALAGFASTPAEEMPTRGDGDARPTEFKCPACGSAVRDGRVAHAKNSKAPAFQCSNKKCQGGNSRDKEDPSKGRWPWATWDTQHFAAGGAPTTDTVAGVDFGQRLLKHFAAKKLPGQDEPMGEDEAATMIGVYLEQNHSGVKLADLTQELGDQVYTGLRGEMAERAEQYLADLSEDAHSEGYH